MSNFQVVCSHSNAHLRHTERPPTTGPVTFSCAMPLRCWMVALRVMTKLGQLSRIRSSMPMHPTLTSQPRLLA